jgi:hypothetical protein
MKITKVLSKLITEDARFQVLYKKYVLPSGDRKKGILPFEIVKSIVFADPTTRVPQNYDIDGASIEDMTSDSIKVGKYTQWMLNIFVKPHLTSEDGEPIEVGTEVYKRDATEYRRHFMEDLPQFKDLLTKYERFKGSLVDSSKKDINTIKSFPELSQLQVKVGNDTVDLGAYRGKKVKKEVGADAKTNFNFPGSEILKVGTDYTLIRISDKGDLGSKAASYFGGYSGGLDRGESNWCTAAEGSSHSHGYRQNGPLYIFMANDDKGQVGQVTGLPTERYQIHFPSNQFKSRDQYSAGGNVPIVEWLNGKWGEFKELLKPEFAAGFVKQNIGGGGDKVDIKYPDSATGKFIALYGFDELFNVLPDSIVELNVINTSNEPINLTIPESISRFKNIKSILFDNVISELPDSICELKNLYFLALPNNKNLKSIPDCVMTSFPNLVIINLVGSNPNVKIPEKMKDHFFENMMYYFEE